MMLLMTRLQLRARVTLVWRQKLTRRTFLACDADYSERRIVRVPFLAPKSQLVHFVSSGALFVRRTHLLAKK